MGRLLAPTGRLLAPTRRLLAPTGPRMERLRRAPMVPRVERLLRRAPMVPLVERLQLASLVLPKQLLRRAELRCCARPRPPWL